MPQATTAKAGQRTARKSGIRKKTANRFAELAGGDDLDIDEPAVRAGDASVDDDGLIVALSSSVPLGDAATRVVHIPVADLAPHPFNDPGRSQPQPGDAKWDELLNGVRANGVRLPVLVVPRKAFAAARPAATTQIPGDAKYILVYGHRRRIAAIEAGRETIPAVVDEDIMTDDGDLDAMAAENLGRQDLSELAEANLFARYSELGLTQRQIATRLGINQATVSRRLALLLMAPQVRQAVEDGKVRAADAAALAGALPYGPHRRWQWQANEDPDQDTEQRRREQELALRLMLARDMVATRAAEWVIAERQARAQADEWGVRLVDDPRSELGERFYEYRVTDYAGQDGLIGAIDPAQGTLVLYARPTRDATTQADDAEIGTEAETSGGRQSSPEQAADAAADSSRTPDPHGDTAAGEQASNGQEASAADDAIAEGRRADAKAAAAAQAHRRQACAALIAEPVAKLELLKILINQYLSGVAARAGTSAVTALLQDWDAHVEGNNEKARLTRTWHRAVAAAELHTSELKDKAWDDDAVDHVRLLVDRVGYQPTAWEQAQLDLAEAN